jgi:hypothetical protein
LSDHLQAASIKYYGVAGIEYLTKLVAETRDLDKEFNNTVKGLIGDEKSSIADSILRSPLDKTATRQRAMSLAPPFRLALCFPTPFANA